MRVTSRSIVCQSEIGTARANLTFPCLASLSDGRLLATYRAGSTKDGEDETIEIVSSNDSGATWSAPRSPFDSPTVDGKHGTVKICYVTELEPEHLLASGLWVDRQTFPGQPLFNPETEGCLPMAVVLADSYDGGESWTVWRHVPMSADIGPPSLTCPILKLRDGRLAMSVESNKTYADTNKWYQKAVLRHSWDQGRTWGNSYIAGFDPDGRIFNWDQRVGVAPDGRLAAFLWTYDRETESYLNIHRRLSSDGGETWSEAEDMGFTDQASHPAVLPDGRIVLAWVDRFNTQTIRARMAPSIDASFDEETEVVVYEHQDPSSGDVDRSGALGFSVWSFGLPFAEGLPDGSVAVMYYAGTEDAMDIHMVRLNAED
ncbi:MAG: exo-alpha-sialidase [Candidatus Latescibacteria bacterium]|nr:exo-alpha-sialidase [Candidatus Latescibacterota bacterium]